MTRPILTQAEQWPHRVAMSYWVADGSEPVHQIPVSEALTYRQYDPRNPPEPPESAKKYLNKDWALSGEEDWHMDLPSWDYDDDDNPIELPSLTDSIRAEGIKTPLEILTDGERAFLGDGIHRSTVAHELGLTHVPAHVIHLKPEELDFYANEAPWMRGRDIPASGSEVRRVVR